MLPELFLLVYPKLFSISDYFFFNRMDFILFLEQTVKYSPIPSYFKYTVHCSRKYISWQWTFFLYVHFSVSRRGRMEATKLHWIMWEDSWEKSDCGMCMRNNTRTPQFACTELSMLLSNCWQSDILVSKMCSVITHNSMHITDLLKIACILFTHWIG